MMGSFGGGLLVVLEKFLYGALIFIFAFGGIVVGIITGAITGQTTETGFVRGAGIGAFAGAIVAIELFESLRNGERSLSKIGIFGSLINGKVFREWVGPAMLKAYQSQIEALETSYREISDIYDVDGTKGLSPNYIMGLPNFQLTATKTMDQCGDSSCCSICLQDFIKGDNARRLPKCRHLFHLACIDEWLVRQGSCPVCREDV